MILLVLFSNLLRMLCYTSQNRETAISDSANDATRVILKSQCFFLCGIEKTPFHGVDFFI